MPTIAEFNGITIRIYYWPREHPPPHFHAIYGDQEACYDMHTRAVTAGSDARSTKLSPTGPNHAAASFPTAPRFKCVLNCGFTSRTCPRR